MGVTMPDSNVYNTSVFNILMRCLFASSLSILAINADAQSLPDFALAPGDTVKLDILDDDKEPTDLPVGMDGSIQAPFLGSVSVAGLTVSQALDELNRRYVAQHIFVVPKLGFSVASYRPVFVIGDVKNPGSFPFQPRLTVEKAIGLAGGQIGTDPAEDPVLARARLRGELDTLEASIVREALAFARLTGELAGRSDIPDEDIPASARDFVNGPLAQSVREVELRIAKADADGFAAQQEVLSKQIKESEGGLTLLDQLLEKVNGTVELSRGDVERAKELRRRGLNTQTDVSNFQRQQAQEESRQLEVLSRLSEARKDVGLLKSRLVELAQTRQVNNLVELQTRNVSLATYLASHRTAEEQLVLMSNLTAQELARNKQVVLDFTIRRGADTSEVPAKATDPLIPGDVLVVRIRASTDDAALASLPEPAAQAWPATGANIPPSP
jgi:protein involved in polysaccharide export with SLBB domain